MQESQRDADLEQVYAIMGNPYMRAILRTLGERGEASFSELKSAIGTSTGNLYYNLDKLEGFVTKNEKRKYVLTEKGFRLYRFMLENESRIRTLISEKRGVAAWVEKYILPVLVPESLVSFLYSDPKLSLLMLAAYSVLTSVSSIYGAYVCFGLDQLFLPVTGVYRLLPALAGLLVLLTALEAPSRLMGGEKRISIEYIATVLAATLPLSIPALLPTDILYVNVLFRLVQILVIGLLTATLKVYKRLPTERAFIAVFTATYVSYNIAFVIQRLF